MSDMVLIIRRRGKPQMRERAPRTLSPRMLRLIATREQRRSEFYRLLAAHGMASTWIPEIKGRIETARARQAGEFRAMTTVMDKKKRPVTLPVGAGHENRKEPVLQEVDSPLTAGTKDQVMVNVRESPLGYWHAKGHIDSAQLRAGLRFRKLWETTILAGAQAIDYERPDVDASPKGDLISDHTLDARDELMRIEAALGTSGYRLMRQICGEGRWPHEIAATQGGGKERERDYIGARARECLSDLAVLWGYAKR